MMKNRPNHSVLKTGKALALSATLIAGLMAGATVQATDGFAAPTQSFAQCDHVALHNGSAQWGFKESFVRYVQGPIARGEIQTSSPVTFGQGSFAFTQGEGLYAMGTHEIEVKYPGSFHFTGHDGQLDSLFSDFTVHIDSVKKTGTISAHVVSKDLAGTVHTFESAIFATIDTSSLARDRTTGQTTLTNAPVTLTVDGAAMLADFYQPGQVLDPISMTVETGEFVNCKDPEPEPVEEENESTEPEETTEPGQPEESVAPEVEETEQPDLPEEPEAPAQTGQPRETGSSDPRKETGSAQKPAPETSAKTPTPKTPVKESSPKTSDTSSKDNGMRGISSGTFAWGIKDSFISYINGPIANGKITVSQGTFTANQATFKGATGAINPQTKKGHITWDGSVHFTGHNGALDQKFSNFLIVFDGKTTAKLVADIDAKRLDGSTFSKKAVHLADVDTKSLSINNNTVTLKDAKTVLTAAGAEAFGGFYDAGQVLAPLTVEAKYSKSAQITKTPKVKASTTQAGKDSGKKPSVIAPAGTTGAENTLDTNGNNAAASQQSSTATGAQPQSEEMVEVCESNVLTDGTVSWPVRQSFTTYIRGAIANGGWTLNNVQFSHPNFLFNGGTGEFDTTAATGLVAVPGSINFHGHKGQLDLTMSNLKIKVTGPNTADLIMDVKSKGYNSPDVNETGVLFAKITGDIKTSDDQVSAQGATVKLTEQGAKAFAGFYSSGEQLDPISFSAKVGEGTGCTEVPASSVASGGQGQSLATTGADQTALLTATALAALLAGGLLTVITRNRRRAAAVGGRD